ncbi:hypothetical protein KAW80_02640 [Candidatus Babeliales bacterium]|nr:hypothetical protein [Candidatus Babeliales bacterium]
MSIFKFICERIKIFKKYLGDFGSDNKSLSFGRDDNNLISQSGENNKSHVGDNITLNYSDTQGQNSQVQVENMKKLLSLFEEPSANFIKGCKEINLSKPKNTLAFKHNKKGNKNWIVKQFEKVVISNHVEAVKFVELKNRAVAAVDCLCDYGKEKEFNESWLSIREGFNSIEIFKVFNNSRD